MNDINLGPVLRAIDRVGSAVVDVERRVADVSVHVGSVADDLTITMTELSELRMQFSQFVDRAQRIANVQRSETKLGTLKDDLDRAFGHYEQVRRSSVGMLQAFDLGNVSNLTVQQVSEELMIQSPRYWLAPALVGVAAWSRDDEQLATRSIEAAFSRDRAKTSLFFALVLRRQRRFESASRWLHHYFSSLDPRMLGREFGVVLESVAQDAFGAGGRQLVTSQLSTWVTKMREDPELVDAQVAKWQTEVSVQRTRLELNAFPTLARRSPDWTELKDVLEHASALAQVREKYDEILSAPVTRSESVEDQLDDLLETLVKEYDEEELPLRREIVFHESVIERDGDLDRARETADSLVAALEETLDAASFITVAALNPQGLGVGLETRKLAIGASSADFARGIGRFTLDYRRRMKSDVLIELDGAHSNYASALSFPGWSGSTSEPEESSLARLDREWDRVIAAQVNRLRFRSSRWVVPGLITLGAVLLFSLIGGVAGFFIGLLVVGGIAAIVTFGKKRRADAAVAQALDQREAAKKVSRQLLREARAEWVDAKLTYKEEDANESGLLSFVEAWPVFALEEESV